MDMHNMYTLFTSPKKINRVSLLFLLSNESVYLFLYARACVCVYKLPASDACVRNVYDQSRLRCYIIYYVMERPGAPGKKKGVVGAVWWKKNRVFIVFLGPNTRT